MRALGTMRPVPCRPCRSHAPLRPGRCRTGSRRPGQPRGRAHGTRHGRHVWLVQAQPKIHAYYAQALDEFSVGDLSHTLHDLLRPPENMQRLDQGVDPAADDAATCPSR